MIIGNNLGLSSAFTHTAAPRDAVILEARVNPKVPNEYSVQLPAEIFTLRDRSAEADSSEKKARQNRDPASQAFLAVADYQAVKHQIDIFV